MQPTSLHPDHHHTVRIVGTIEEHTAENSASDLSNTVDHSSAANHKTSHRSLKQTVSRLAICLIGIRHIRQDCSGHDWLIYVVDARKLITDELNRNNQHRARSGRSIEILHKINLNLPGIFSRLRCCFVPATQSQDCLEARQMPARRLAHGCRSTCMPLYYFMRTGTLLPSDARNFAVD